ncbi:hypothetical protein LWI28_023306 [Acer negundo]|uniref:Epidermal patterning factor-like protein n=1 Tax=Acer negundo TaxID=4023 RepID=A0AAD5JAU7_ACENE|nr:hypothetical protein LWI28_023306 [Acer negundo]KAK4854229.1 hypothetical protein QYF36_020845 [Acer negundo]
MASSSSNYQSGGLPVAMILIIMLLLISLIPSKTVGLGFPSYKKDRECTSVQLKEKEKVVGSRPPGCSNKCLTCRPCMATLVIQPHQWKWNNIFKRFFKTTSHDDEEAGDSSYYLLSWKCKCNNKLFQP